MPIRGPSNPAALMVHSSSADPTPEAAEANRQFLMDVTQGLAEDQKSLPCKYFYDQRGSQLFDQICDLAEYYPTRTELGIMQRYSAEMGEQIGEGAVLIEFGSGSSTKTRLLLDHLTSPVAYVPVDVSREHLHLTAAELTREYPDIEILPVCADFTKPFALPRLPGKGTHKAVYFPGSTIGNFEVDDAETLLSQIVELCGSGGGLLIGIDLQKDVQIIEAAYNDRQGITADFNRNLLHRINRELGADFEVDRFEHVAEYNAEMGRVEIYLESTSEQTVHVDAQRFEFEAGERICTEYSHKYTIEGFSKMAAKVGLTLRKQWLDPNRYFAVLHYALLD